MIFLELKHNSQPSPHRPPPLPSPQTLGTRYMFCVTQNYTEVNKKIFSLETERGGSWPHGQTFLHTQLSWFSSSWVLILVPFLVPAGQFPPSLAGSQVPNSVRFRCNHMSNFSLRDRKSSFCSRARECLILLPPKKKSPSFFVKCRGGGGWSGVWVDLHKRDNTRISSQPIKTLQKPRQDHTPHTLPPKKKKKTATKDLQPL